MKDSRLSRSMRDRKSHLSPDAERLVTGSLGLANSGSRTEDRYWESYLEQRIERLYDSGHVQPLHDALDRLQQADLEAHGALVEAIETSAETMRIEVDGQPWDALLLSAPIIAWTRFAIPAGPVPGSVADALAVHWQAHVLASGVRFRLVPFLYSLDQLPRDFTDVRRMTKRLAQAVASEQPARLELRSLPETADMLADTRFVLAMVAAPAGQPMFRWQEIESREHASRVQCLEQWVAQGRPHIEPLLPGCGFECLLPDAYHINLRESDRRVRPYMIKAAVHFLTHAFSVEASELRASIAAFGEQHADEYRIGLSVGDRDEVAQGIVWPLLGAEREEDDPSPLERIKQTLREAGVTDIRTWPELTEPDFCEDCGAPLYPNPKGEVAHAEMPDDVEPESRPFH